MINGQLVTNQVPGTQLRYRPKFVWKCNKCAETFRADSIRRLRQHLIGRFLESDEHVHTRLCEGMTGDDMDDLKAIMAALMRLTRAGETTTAASGADRIVVDSPAPNTHSASLPTTFATTGSDADDPPPTPGPATNTDVRHAVAQFVISTGSAFRIVENNSFRMLLDIVRRLPHDTPIRIPSRELVAGPLLDDALKASTDELETLVGGCREIFGTTVCHDSWTSGVQQSYSHVATVTKGLECFHSCFWDTKKTAPVIAEQVSRLRVRKQQ
eukprot:GHVU01170849.1.p1 GENE.GHVU01170849.1~~GHVU01170849.1.p1  ORF type:complete len:270 (-),score=23.33 GHVU01170849.1:159-968(-)